MNPAATVVWVLKRRKRLFYMAASSVAKRVPIMNLFPSPPDEETL